MSKPFKLWEQIGLLVVGSALLLVLAQLFRVPAELALPVVTSLPGGIIALSRAASVKVPK